MGSSRLSAQQIMSLLKQHVAVTFPQHLYQMYNEEFDILLPAWQRQPAFQ